MISVEERFPNANTDNDLRLVSVTEVVRILGGLACKNSSDPCPKSLCVLRLRRNFADPFLHEIAYFNPKEGDGFPSQKHLCYQHL